MPKPTYRQTPLAAAVAVALGATSTPAMAQSSSGEPIEEIVTTGIRGSLMRSMDIKRASDGVVDAINAEDIGSFPDTNLAESLQRITGVSIDRERGEGARVTVRGFGPQFNLVLLNGRQMPTSGGPSGGTDRSYDFGDLASEAVSRVEVYKTGQANVPTGGIGSTINIRTTRPLEAPGLQATVAASGMYDQSRTKRESTDFTGEISGLFSNTFADDKIGVALTLVRQDRESGGATASVGGWRSFDGARHQSWGAAPGACDSPNAPADITPYVGQEEWGGIPIPCFTWEGQNQVNRPEPGEIYSVPQVIGYELADYDRTRTNGQLTLQFRPVDSFTATLDYTYSDLELDRTYNNLSAWFNFGGQQTIWPDGDNVTPEEYTEFGAGADFSMGAGQDAFKNEDNSVGLNLLWDISDNFTAALDYHDSSAKSGPGSKWGNSALISIASYTRDVTSGYFGQELPVLELGLSSPLSADDMVVTGSVFRNDRSEMNIEQLRLGGTLEFDGFVETIDFGIQLTDVDNTSQQGFLQRDTWSAQTPLGALSDLMTPSSTNGAFDQIPGSGDERLQTDYFLFDMAAVIARSEDLMAQGLMPIVPASNGSLGPCGTALCPPDSFDIDRRTTEETQAAYVQANMAWDMGNMGVSLRAGLRYEQTDVTSRALVPAYEGGLIWNSGNELAAVQVGDGEFTRLTGDYDYWLPNLDFRLDISDSLVGRISYSETLTRPNYVDIQGGVNITTPIRVAGGLGNRGNPALLPYESDNIDLSLEYYYSDRSYLSVGYFTKDVENFIGISSVSETVFDLPHPGLGPLADAARAAGAQSSAEIYDYILANFPNEPGVDAVNGVITGIEGRDPYSPFDLTIPVNINKATVDGWEINLQHDFGDTGFGLIANATFVDADVGYDNNSLTEQFVIVGLSDSANFVGYYENDSLGIRLAYNWRDAFLAGTGQTNIGSGPPTYVDEYGQWDLNANWWFRDNFQVFLDVINITDETTYVYGRQKDQILFASQLGTRYNIGVRYKF